MGAVRRLPQYPFVWLEVEPIKPLRVNLAKPLRVSGPYDDYAYYTTSILVLALLQLVSSDANTKGA
jgi:hypothetical protein